jgi:hypothetical protein
MKAYGGTEIFERLSLADGLFLYVEILKDRAKELNLETLAAAIGAVSGDVPHYAVSGSAASGVYSAQIPPGAVNGSAVSGDIMHSASNADNTAFDRYF